LVRSIFCINLLNISGGEAGANPYISAYGYPSGKGILALHENNHHTNEHILYRHPYLKMRYNTLNEVPTMWIYKETGNETDETD
jgi:hypothetical protein